MRAERAACCPHLRAPSPSAASIQKNELLPQWAEPAPLVQVLYIAAAAQVTAYYKGCSRAKM